MRTGTMLLLTGSVVWLSGCAATPHMIPICPSLVGYSKDDQTALKAELDAHPDLKVTRRFLRDYVGLRDQVRSCLGKS